MSEDGARFIPAAGQSMGPAFESAEAFEAFAQSHAPVYEALGISVEQILEHATVFEIDRKIIK